MNAENLPNAVKTNPSFQTTTSIPSSFCKCQADQLHHPTAERNLQLEKVKTLYQFCLNKRVVDCVIGFVKHHLAADPECTDIVHDLLAFLATQMLEMNKAKGEEIRGFLHWLERESGAKIEALQNKTAIQSYFDLSLEDLLGILRRNRRSIPVDLSSRDFQESLEREFTASLAKLTPLLTCIQGTDALIDQVVYQQPIYAFGIG